MINIKKLLFVVAFASMCVTALSQSTDRNYVKSVNLAEAMEWGDIIDRGGIDNISHTTEVVYYDGLGRPVQDISNISGQTASSAMTYDTSGRTADTWLAVPTYGDFKYFGINECSNSAANFYGDTQAFSSTSYDALGRVASVKTAGSNWKAQGKEKAVRYGTNAEREVKRYKAPMEKVSLVDGGFYPAATLTCETYTDEDGRTLAVYKDFFGNKVLERRNGGNDTYFVYDDIGRLRYVLSPEYQKSGYKDMYAYEYRYDTKGRIVKKILPGCEYTQYWYDGADRVAFMQDATLRGKGLYRFFLYDPLGRLAVQGLCKSCIRSEDVCMATYRKSADGLSGTGYELGIADKISGITLETVNYYDDYDFLKRCTAWAGALKDSLSADNGQYSTGSKTGCVQFVNESFHFVDVMYYNIRSRIIGERKIYGKERLTVQNNEYTFTDKLKRQITSEYRLVNGVSVYQNRNDLINTYDKHDALAYTDFSVYDKNMTAYTQRIKSYCYDGIGRVKSVTRGGNAGNVSYAYNLHGWTTNIDSKDFYEELHYTDGVGTPRYNGSVSSQLWSAADYGQVRGYKFEYDWLDRLTEAVYGETPSLSDKENRYNEKVIEYTANGAMKRFQRRGRKDNGEYGKIDNLNIKLNGNQLLSVTDDALPANKYSSFNFIDGANETVEYEFNGVGALTKDLNRGITIRYDNLGYPRRIDFKDGNSITYTYLPDGTLLSKKYGLPYNIEKEKVNGVIGIDNAADRVLTEADSLSDTIMAAQPGMILFGETEYSGNIIYKNGKLDKVLFPGGYCTFDKEENDLPIFHYYTQDHLGNNRVVTNEDGTVEQIVHYYPFGGTFNDAGLNTGLQQYKYNGKELDRVAGLNTYDYGARQYFSPVPTWDRMDALCEKYYNISPYAYCKNNPIKFIDLWGMVLGDYYDNKNNYIGSDGINDNEMYVLRTTNAYFDSYSEYGQRVKVTNISKKQAKAAIAEIQSHNGDSSYDFSNARNSFVRIDGTTETRRKVMSLIKDDGTGGDKPNNNREYLVYFDKQDQTDIRYRVGDIGNPDTDRNISIQYKGYDGIAYFHTHPSGNYSAGWAQPPSVQDISNGENFNMYVIGMGNKTVYIYNKNEGIITSFPINTFLK